MKVLFGRWKDSIQPHPAIERGRETVSSYPLSNLKSTTNVQSPALFVSLTDVRNPMITSCTVRISRINATGPALDAESVRLFISTVPSAYATRDAKVPRPLPPTTVATGVSIDYH